MKELLRNDIDNLKPHFDASEEKLGSGERKVAWEKKPLWLSKKTNSPLTSVHQRQIKHHHYIFGSSHKGCIEKCHIQSSR